MLGRGGRTNPYQDGAEIRVGQVQDSSIQPLYVGILRFDDIGFASPQMSECWGWASRRNYIEPIWDLFIP